MKEITNIRLQALLKTVPLIKEIQWRHMWFKVIHTNGEKYIYNVIDDIERRAQALMHPDIDHYNEIDDMACLYGWPYLLGMQEDFEATWKSQWVEAKYPLIMVCDDTYYVYRMPYCGDGTNTNCEILSL